MAEIQIGGGSLSLGMVLFIVFLVLKLTGVIAWSWWWITAPLWFGFALVLGIIGIIMLFALIASLLSR